MRLSREGRIILTVPSPRVDELIPILIELNLFAGLALEQHTGIDPLDAPSWSEDRDFTPVKHRSFLLGLNHIFVFDLPPPSVPLQSYFQSVISGFPTHLKSDANG